MENFDPVELGAKVGVFFVPFLFALCFHEYAHGWVAKLKGDRTAEISGRLTMNPLVHMDILGTLILPLMAIILGGLPFFGWAKPVPVSERNLKHPKQDMFWIALAGPLSNLLLAVIAGVFVFPAVVIATGAQGVGNALLKMLDQFILINLFLAVFNFIPLHPLDGGKVAARFLPYSANRWLEDHQDTLSWVLVILFMLGGFRFLAPPVYWLDQIILSSGAHLMQLFGK